MIYLILVVIFLAICLYLLNRHESNNTVDNDYAPLSNVSSTEPVTKKPSETMIRLATKWTEEFIQSAPKLRAATYKKDEIYMFCCWIVLDYGKNYGYLNKDSKLDGFYETVCQAVKNTGEYNQTEMEQFLFRVSQYKSQMMGMLKCDYPRTKMFFPETLYARFVNIDFDQYHPDPFGIDDNLIRFSEYLGSFWNKVNRELINKFPKRK